MSIAKFQNKSVFLFLIACSFLLLPNVIWAKAYSGKTKIFYERSHGIQVEYYSSSGGAYLWYPGNRGVVKGRWRRRGKQICFQYGANTYNPVTKKRGGRWECMPVAYHQKILKGSCKGDVFNLATGRIPYVLRKRRFGLVKLTAKC